MPPKRAKKKAPKKKKKAAKKKVARKRRTVGQRYLELERVGETAESDVVFRIVEQTHREDFHPEGEEEEFRASNGYQLLSSSQPQWDTHTNKFYVRGADKYMDQSLCVADEGDWDEIQIAVKEYNAWVINTHWSTAFRNFSICASGKEAMQKHKKAMDWFMAGLLNTECCEWLRDSFNQNYDGFGEALHKAFTMKSGPLPKVAKKAGKKKTKKKVKKKAKKKAKR